MAAMTDYASYYTSLLWGCFISLVLFGFSSCLTLIYFRFHSSDPWKLKTSVATIWALETIHTCFTARVSYGVFVPRFGNNADAMSYATSGVFTTGLISVVITTLVQWFFAFRLYKLSTGEEATSPTTVKMMVTRAFIPILSAVFSLARLVSFVGTAVYQALHHQGTAGWKWCLFTVGILSIVSDLLVAGGLFTCLWKRWKSQKRLQENSLMLHFTVINRVFVIAIEANLFTCLITSITTILYNLSDGYTWVGMAIVASGLFSISFLTSVLRAKKQSHDDESQLHDIDLAPVDRTTVASTVSPSMCPDELITNIGIEAAYVQSVIDD